jgi:FixJ family two-component response regulator
MAATSLKAVTPTVIIIDDDDSVRRALGRLMKTVGQNVELFACAEDFLQALASEASPKSSTDITDFTDRGDGIRGPRAIRGAGFRTPNSPICLILDLHLPGLSGLELQDRLKTEGRNFPIVFITAFTDDLARERALEAGAIAFLHKPFEERDLLDAVEKGLAL